MCDRTYNKNKTTIKNKTILNPTLDYKHKLKVITKYKNMIQQEIIKLNEKKIKKSLWN